MRSLDAYADYLVERHSEDQDTIANNLVLALFPLWQIMDFEELDDSTVLWLQAVVPVIRTAFLQSQRLTAVMVANVRFASLPEEEPVLLDPPNVEQPLGVPLERFTMPDLRVPGSTSQPTIPMEVFPESDVATSMTIEGNFGVKAQMPGPEEELMHNALVNSSGAGIRQGLKGSRSVVSSMFGRDRRLLGYARKTDGDPCHFCALLASRGAVYTKESFADSDASFKPNKRAIDVPDEYVRVAKVHNNCRCTLRPVYSQAQEFDDEAAFYRKQWEAVYKKWDGKIKPKQIVEKWREQYTPYQRPAPSVADFQEALAQRHSDLLDAGYSPLDPRVAWAERAQNQLVV